MRFSRLKHALPWILVAGVAIGIRLRILLVLGTLWHDEAFTRRFALLPLGQMLDLLKFDVHPPLHAILAHYWLVLGDDARVFRLLSLVTAAVGLFAFARLAETLVGKKAAFLAFVLAAFSPLMAYYAADGRMYALVFLLSCLSSLTFWRAIRVPESSRPYVFRDAWFWSSIALALTHVSGVLVLAAQFLWLMRTPERRARLKKLAVGFTLIGFVFALWLVPAATARLATAGAEWQFAPANDGLPAPLALAYWLWLERGKAALTVLFAVVALCIAAAVMRRSERRPFFRLTEEGEYLLFWLGCTFLPFLAVAATAPRYLMAAVPPFFMLVAAGFMNAGKNKNSTLALGVAGIAILSFVGLLALSAARSYNWDKDVDWISTRFRPGDRVVFAWYADKMAFSATEQKPFSRDLSGFGELRGLYPYDDNLSFDQRLVAHAGTLGIHRTDLDRLSELMEGANRVFFIPNNDLKLTDGGSAPDAVTQWIEARGWRLLDHRDNDGRTSGVWLLIKK